MSFLSDVADHLLDKYGNHLGDCTVIFPNRRAGLFLKKQLAAKLSAPVFAPNTFSLEDYLFSFSPIKKSDALTLIFLLYQAFKEHKDRQNFTSNFDAFFPWGEMLLRDFEEVDHYLIDPKQLFTLIKDEKQLAEDFYFLDKDQEILIQKFWQEFLPSATDTQKKFIQSWEILYPVYQAFKKELTAKQIGYTSHIYRSLLHDIKVFQEAAGQPIIFAGFNALTAVEENLIKHFVQNLGAEVLWDVNAYYIDDERQEAGDFIREYQKDTVFGPTFNSASQREIDWKQKSLITHGVSLEVGQTKLLSEQLSELLAQGVKEEEIVVILPQDYMLFPMLNALPSEVKKLNITMGYPLKDTPLYGLLEACLELQEQATLSPKNGISFYHKQVLDILGHPYLYQEEDTLGSLLKDIKKKNQIRVFQEEILKTDGDILGVIFQKKNSDHLLQYLQDILMELEKCVVERFGMEKEYLYHFKQVIHQLYTLLDQQQMIVELSTFRNLFKKIAGSLKIPFSGEPVEGLQVMGVLETRNLDFKYVFMLNMNESVFPASNRKGSFVPYRIRKAFGMPTFSAQDAIYAYLFYRLFHTGEVFHCYYNTYADFGLSGEVSRFIRQLSHETNIPIHKRKLSNPIMLREVKEISIETTEAVIQKLMIYTDQVPEKQQRRLSASALNAYIDCPLKFYFRYVLRLFSEDEISQELDARHFGNVLHGTMEILYRDNMAEKGAKTIDENDFFRLENSVTGAIEKAFRKEFGMKENHRFEFKDRNVVMSEVIKSFADRILQLDKAYAPFQIISLEEDDKYQRFVPIQTKARNIGVKLGAAIDRVDKKGDEVRILDYKTGRDETDIGRFEHLFGGEMTAKHQKARKAGYQTFFYAWLYVSKMGGDGPIIPGLINMKQVFQPDFDYRLIMDGKPLNDVSGYLAVFEEKLKVLLQEIFDPQIPFARREHSKQCAYCEYQSICEG